MSSFGDTSSIYRIGEWRVDTRMRRLSRDGVSVQLEPKVMLVLSELVAHAGEPVSREALHQRVWEDAFVGEDPLNRAISELRKAFGDNSREPRYIETIHKLGYRLIAQVEPEVSVPSSAIPVASQRWDGWARVVWPLFAGALVASTVASLFGWPAISDRGRGAPPASELASHETRVIPVTSDPGRELFPALSPTRKEVTYLQSTDEGVALYVKELGADAPRRLTSGEQDSLAAAWTPDGERVVFTRGRDPGCGVVAVSRTGGVERMVYACRGSQFLGIDAAPDGTLVLSEREAGQSDFALFLWRDEKKKRLSMPEAGQRDTIPRFSPDGARVAFRRSAGERAHRLYWLDLATPDRLHLVLEGADVAGFDWTADGAALVASTNLNGTFGLWRLPLKGESRWMGFTAAFVPSVSPQGLVFEKRSGTVNIWRWPLGAAPGHTGATRVLASSHQDLEPRYAPDGKRIAFISDRSGSYELWLARPDGSENNKRLTSFGQRAPGWIPTVTHPRWSPDGSSLVVSADLEGKVDLYVVPASGGVARPLTRHVAEDRSPCWSRDGKWIYHVSEREGAGRWSLWRIRTDGSSAQRLARAGRHDVLECPAPGVVYQGDYTRGEVRLLRILSDGRIDAEVLTPALSHPDWTVHDGRLLTIVPDSEGYAFAFALDRGPSHFETVRVGSLRPAGGVFAATGGVDVSPDGRYVLASVLETNESDIVFVDEFR